MHKALSHLLKKEMGEGEKKAPVKSIKLKVKFQSEAKGRALAVKKGKKEEEELAKEDNEVREAK